MKKLLLCGAMLLTAWMSSHAADFKVDDLYYNINSDGTSVSVARPDNGYYSLPVVTIPSSVSFEGVTYDVTAIGDSAFYRSSSLYKVTFASPSKVETIGTSAFQESNIVSVSLPNSFKTIGVQAFQQCYSLHQITIPEGVEVINKDAFYGCQALTAFKCPKSLKQIGYGAFSASGLRSISFNEGLERIGEFAFSYCFWLPEKIEFPNSLLTTGNNIFYRNQYITTINIPQHLNLQSATKTFIPASVKNITVDPQCENFYIEGNGLYYKTQYAKQKALVRILDDSPCVPYGTTNVYADVAVGIKADYIVLPKTTISCHSVDNKRKVYCLNKSLSLNLLNSAKGSTFYVPKDALENFKKQYSQYADTIVGIDTEVNLSDCKMLKDAQMQLNAGMHSIVAEALKLTWSSSNEAVATVDANGVVKAIAPGKAVISVQDVTGATKQCEISVLMKGDMNEDMILDVSDINSMIDIILN